MRLIERLGREERLRRWRRGEERLFVSLDWTRVLLSSGELGAVLGRKEGSIWCWTVLGTNGYGLVLGYIEGIDILAIYHGWVVLLWLVMVRKGEDVMFAGLGMRGVVWCGVDGRRGEERREESFRKFVYVE